MIYKTSLNEVEQYRLNPALNQSKLKTLLYNMEVFKNSSNEREEYFEEKESLVIGSAVDAMICSTEEDYKQTFHVSSDENKPSSTIMNILKYVYNISPEGLRKTLPLHNLQDKISEAVDKFEYYPKWPIQTRINKILENYQYFEDLQLAEGKQVLSKEQEDISISIVNSFKSNKLTSILLGSSLSDTYYQKPLYFTYKGVKCKALPDIITVRYDSNKNPISVFITDIKTMSGFTTNFGNSLRRFRYDIQAAWYMEALKANLKTLGLPENIKIEPFLFLVESTTNTGSPVIYRVTENLLNIGKFGRKELRGNGILVSKEIRGFDSLLDEHLYYEKNGWIVDRRIEKTVVDLDWDNF